MLYDNSNMLHPIPILNNVIKTKANATDNRLASSIAVYVKYTFIKLSPAYTKRWPYTCVYVLRPDCTGL